VGLLYYRRDLLAKHGFEPPVTWAALADQVRRIRAAEGDPTLEGYLWQGKQYEGMIVNVLEALWAHGTGLLGDDGTVFPEPERAGRPRPVTPSYLLLSTTLQPELSAVLVGLKSERRAIVDARRRLDYFLASNRRATRACFRHPTVHHGLPGSAPTCGARHRCRPP